MVVTIPLGYNPYLDQTINEGEIRFAQQSYLKRKPNRKDSCEDTADVVRLPYYDRAAFVAHELFTGIIQDRWHTN